MELELSFSVRGHPALFQAGDLRADAHGPARSPCLAPSAWPPAWLLVHSRERSSCSGFFPASGPPEGRASSPYLSFTNVSLTPSLSWLFCPSQKCSWGEFSGGSQVAESSVPVGRIMTPAKSRPFQGLAHPPPFPGERAQRELPKGTATQLVSCRESVGPWQGELKARHPRGVSHSSKFLLSVCRVLVAF